MLRLQYVKTARWLKSYDLLENRRIDIVITTNLFPIVFKWQKCLKMQIFYLVSFYFKLRKKSCRSWEQVREARTTRLLKKMSRKNTLAVLALAV